MNNDLKDLVFSEIVTIRDRLLLTESPLRLESGEPSFDTPEHIKEAMTKALADNATHYAPSTGILPFREVIAEKLVNENKITYLNGPNDVTVTNGGMQALYVALRTLLNRGDEVIVPNPNWPATARMIEFVGGTVLPVRLSPELGYQWDPEELDRAVTSRTKAIVVNNPHNPTGAVANRQQLTEILEVAQKHKLYIISDEAYEHIVYDLPHICIAAVAADFPREVQERIFSCFTLSKSYAMTGWRIGYAVNCSTVIGEAIKKSVLYTTNGVSTPSQFAGIAAITGDQECVTRMRDIYRERRDLLYAGLRESSLFQCENLPQGAFYLYPRVSEQWSGSSRELVEHLIDSYSLGCAPGEAFLDSDKTIRFSYACDTDMINRAVKVLKEIK